MTPEERGVVYAVLSLLDDAAFYRVPGLLQPQELGRPILYVLVDTAHFVEDGYRAYEAWDRGFPLPPLTLSVVDEGWMAAHDEDGIAASVVFDARPDLCERALEDRRSL